MNIIDIDMEVSLKVGCLPYAFGKQLSRPVFEPPTSTFKTHYSS